MNNPESTLSRFRPVQGPASLLFVYSEKRTPIFLGNIFKGATAFLICSGPSLKNHDLTLLKERGILTCSINNAGSQLQTNIWVSFDNPGNFSDAIWRDPAILKFAHLGLLGSKIRVRDSGNNLVDSSFSAGEMPNTFGYLSNSEFRPDKWLTEDTINCGQTGKAEDALGIIGSRSVMLVAIRLLYYLGVRRLYLLGCDFRMKYGEQNYAFEQQRTRRSVRGNNKTYRALNARFQELKPHFDEAGYHVFNCTPRSGLSVFPYVEYETAIQAALECMPNSIDTSGMYETRKEDQSKNSIENRG